MFLIGFCVFSSILFLYLSWFSYRQSERNRLQEWIMERAPTADDSGKVTMLKMTTRQFTKFFGFLFPKGMAAQSIRERLNWAGYHHIDVETYFTIRMLFLLLPLLMYPIMAGFSPSGWILGAVIGGVFFMAPEYFLNIKIRGRNEQIEKELLPVTELLLTSCEAGLTIENAIARITRVNTGLFGRILRQGYQYMNGLMTRDEAFLWMIQQTNNESVHLFIEGLSQSKKYGSGISGLLNEQLVRIRNDIQNKGITRAQAANGRMLMPTMVFIFVPLLVMMIGPLLMNLGKIF